MRLALATASLALLLPVAAAAQAPPAVKSANVTHVGFLNEPSIISARFRGNVMFTSGERGVASYDISDPAKPQKLDDFPLPHFENEDVDLNGRIMLVSNDPSEGKGVLYILDVSNPRDIKLLSTFDTGVIDLFVPLPSQSPIRYGTGHTASCIQDCQFAYLAGTRMGIDIVDLRDPTKPKYAGNFKPGVTGDVATHDVQVDSEGLAWIAGYDGTAAYDVTNPLAPTLVFQTDDAGRSQYGENPSNDGSTLNDFIHHNSYRLDNGSLANPPEGAAASSESNVVLITEEDYTRPTCAGAGSFQTWQIGDTGTVYNLDSWEVETDPSKTSLCSAHYFDERGGLVAQGWYEQGTRFLDVTNPRDIRQVGFWIPAKNVTWGALYAPTDPAGEIVYSLDNARGIDVLRIDRGAPAVAGPPPQQPQPTGGPQPRVSVRLGLGNRKRRVRAGKRVRYNVTLSNISPRARARNVQASVELPRNVRRIRGGRYDRSTRLATFRVKELPARKKKVFRLVVKVKRGRHVELTGSLVAQDDVNPRDNYAVDRDRVRKRRARRASGSRSLTVATARMDTVVAPVIDNGAIRAAASAWGYVCRIAGVRR